MILLRVIAALAGAGILAAVAHVTIMATGGYGWDTNAPLTIALAFGVAVGAPVAGATSRAPACLLCLALIAGELYGFQATASWHVAHLEAQAAPIHQLQATRSAAQEWLVRIERDDRVERAERALREAQTDARTKSTDKGCGQNCRAILAKTVDDATAAVADARSSLQLEQRQARAALDRAVIPPSASPLADRLGVPAWELDLCGAGLRSFASTVLAFALLAFAVHGRQHERAPPPSPKSAEAKSEPLANNVVQIPKPCGVKRPLAVGEVDQFLASHVTKAIGASVSWVALFVRYREWCEANNATPVDVSAFGARLDALREGAGLRTHTKGKEVFFVDWKLAS